MRAGPEIRALVKFARLNLNGDDWPPAASFDLVFCRNVLIYFDRTLQAKVHELFTDSLVTFGVLALGSKESLRLSPVEERFETLSATEKLYRKVK
jgi:chemotaxis protein methyltransferase CheR